MRRRIPDSSAVPTLRIDWPACQGRGLCAAVLPAVIALDPWGFPILAADLDPGLVRRAREAAALCPHAALRVVTDSAARG